MTDGVDTGVLPGMGDLPERVPPTPAAPRSVPPRKRGGKKGAKQPAETLPVARVAVDMPLARKAITGRRRIRRCGIQSLWVTKMRDAHTKRPPPRTRQRAFAGWV